MKKIIITLIVIAFTLSLFGMDFHVGPNQTYTTIQAAYNAAINYGSDNANIIIHPGTYQENIDLSLFYQQMLSFRSVDPDDPAIVYATIIKPSNIAIPIFERINTNWWDAGISISGLTFTTDSNIHSGMAIKYDYNAVMGLPLNFITDCNFSKFDIAVFNLSSSNALILNHCTLGENNTGFYGYANPDRGSSFSNSLFYENDCAILDKTPLNSGFSTHISNCTIVDNVIGIEYKNIILNNDIIYNNSQDNLFASIPAPQITVTYSDIGGGFTGTGNINQDPVFCMDNDYKYHLEETSPCIDAGDPNDTSGDVRIDMGCYETTTDIKSMQGLDHINWVSFPRLQRTGNNPYDGPTLFNNTTPFPEFFSLDFNEQQDLYGVPDNPTYWVPAHYPIRSSKGYKIDLTSVDEYHLLPEEGTRLDSSFVIHLDAGENWVGYWLPGSENWSDALGICKDDFTQIKAENWTMTKVGSSWWGPSNATFTYGKGYVMYVDRNAHPGGIDFYWNITFHTGGRYKKATPENFTYQEKPDYEVIDIQSIEGGENIDEIGAFVNGVCVGASKVEEYPVQILAYTEDANKGGDDNTIYFEVASGKGVKKKINDIYEYNPKTDKYEKTVITAGSSREHLITLGKNDYTEHPVNLNLSLNNYPNPFNPETQISFTLPKDEHIKIEIYNIKGQKVKTLANGKYQKGNQTITWKGLNDNGKKVSSGIYLYKLITKDKTINKKMLMLK